MLLGGVLMSASLFLGLLEPNYGALLALWFVLGAGTSLVLTPAGRLLRQSCREEDRPALFSAQFSLSHACWLLAYPLAGWMGATVGITETFAVLGAVALGSTATAALLWPRHDSEGPDPENSAQQHEHLHYHDEDHQHEHEGWEGPEPHSHPHRHTPGQSGHA
jgi:predicted MFS family arabinose efflux permease